MGTPTSASSLAKLVVVLIVAALAGACTGFGSTAKSPSPVASLSRTASPSAIPSANPSAAPAAGSFGVLLGSSGGNYMVSLVGVDGRIVASSPSTSPGAISCANGAAAVLPAPISSSNTRVYWMDGDGVVRFMAGNGDRGQATTLLNGPTRRSMFAVSPDDQRIAVIVVDFTAGGASTRLYVEDLIGGGHHLDTFSQTGAFTLWPTGWHGTNNLVVAKVPACSQGGGPFCCGPQEFHVVDPDTAVRKFTVGGPTCIIAGPPTPAGAVCETDAQATVLTWNAVTTRSFSIPGYSPAYLSPNGSQVAITTTNDTLIQESNRTFAGMLACGWIDETHLLSAADSQRQARIGDVTTGVVVPVQGVGVCGGRIPGGL